MVRFPSTMIEVTLRPVPTPRKRSVAAVTDESLAGWKAFSLRHGMTPTAFAEALGRRLGSLTASLDELPEVVREIVLEARAIAAESRSRPRRDIT